MRKLDFEVWKNDENGTRLIAGFAKLPDAKNYLAHKFTPFSMLNVESECYTILYKGGRGILFSEPAMILESISVVGEKTKRELADETYPNTTYDFSVPQPWLDEMVDVLKELPDIEWDKYEIYRIVLGGTVWLYPKSKIGFFGLPACTTKEAEELLTRAVVELEKEG